MSYVPSNDAQVKVAAFDQSNTAYKAALDKFLEAHRQEIEYLEKLRDDRNSKLDSAVRVMRAEAEAQDITVTKSITCGPFRVVKKWSSFYDAERFYAIAQSMGLIDDLTRNKQMAVKVEVGKFDAVKEYLKAKGVERQFEECEDGRELTPSVYGPKPAMGFGDEAKDRKVE